MVCFNRKDVDFPVRALLIALLVLAGCSKGPIGNDARLGEPTSLRETRQALRSSAQELAPKHDPSVNSV